MEEIKRRGGGVKGRSGPPGHRHHEKHGGYTVLAALDGRREIDGQSPLGLELKRLREALVSDLGASRWEDLSEQQRILVTRVIHKHLFAESIEAWLLEHGPLRKNGTVRPALGSNYLAIANSLRLDLITLGLERRTRDVTDLALAIQRAQREGASDE